MDTSTTVTSRCWRSRMGVKLGLLAMALVLQACDSDERAATPDCNGMGRPIVFAGLDWDSAQIHNHVAGKHSGSRLRM